MKTYTVKELYDVLGEAIEKGQGDFIILVPNSEEDMSAEYATFREISFCDYGFAKYAYFEQNCGEEEEEYWAKKEEE